jgi:PilZ domain
MSQSPLPCNGVVINPDTRRAFERYASSRPFPRRLMRADTFATVEGWIVDLSEGGIGMLVDQQMAQNDLLLLELEAKTGAQPVKVGACVVFCEPTHNGEFRLGCSFISPLGPEDLRDLLE